MKRTALLLICLTALVSCAQKQEEQKVYIQFAVLAGAVVVCITAKLISNANKKKFEDLSDIYNR